MLLIASAQHLEDSELVSAVSLLFAPGERPCAGDIRALAEQGTDFTVSHDSSLDDNNEEGWMELLANGLTFDLVGLAPGPGAQSPETIHSFGIDERQKLESDESVMIVPGPHLAGGGAMLPVVRTLAKLAAHLCALDSAKAVAWHPARALSEAQYFRRGVLRWIEGGAFPGLGLSALVSDSDGGLRSEGLALFTGQELRLSPDVASDRANGAKIALRLINWLVEHGEISESYGFTGPSGETLRLEPSHKHGIVEVWRGSH